MKKCFSSKVRLSTDNWHMIKLINGILSEYSRQGYRLTLRQLYYQLVSRDLIPNQVKEYTKLSTLLTRARMAGAVDWEIIEDRGRVPYIPYFNDDIADALNDAVRTYRLDRQKDQDVYIEIMVEKDALSGILRRVASKYHIHLIVNKGYASTTAIYDAYNRIKPRLKMGQKCYLFYLGDHDPSGLDMDRDIRERLQEFATNDEDIWEWYDYNDDETVEIARECAISNEFDLVSDGEKFVDVYRGYARNLFDSLVTLKRIGLTSEQVQKYNPPPNPAKFKDPRAEWYVKKYGRISWEVDALNPTILNELVTSNVESVIDIDKYNKLLEQERNDKDEIKRIIEELSL